MNDLRSRRHDLRFWLASAWLAAFSLYFYSFTFPNNPQFSRLDVWLELPELLLALVPGMGDPAAPAGWIYFPQRLDLLLIAAAILCGAWSLGRMLLRGLGVEFAARSAEGVAFACGLGLAGLSLTTLGVGLAGWLTQSLMWQILAACVLGEFLLSRRAGNSARPAAAAPAADARGRGTRRADNAQHGLPPRWWWLVVAPFLLAMLLGAMLPSVDFDVKEYHLQGPKEFYLAGRITFLPHNVYTTFPFLTEMLTLLAMVLRDDWFRGALAGKAVLMTFAPLTAFALYAAGKRWFDPTVGYLAAVIYLTTPWTYRLAIIAYVEGALTFYLLAALLAVMLGVERPDEKDAGRVFLLGGVLAGSAMACKYTGLLMVVVPMAAVVLIAPVWTMRAAGWRGGMRHLYLFLLGTALAIGPWLLKNVAHTGNPVYPLAYSIFGGRDWDPQLDAKWRAGHSPDHHQLSDLAEKFIDVTAKSDWLSPLLFGLAPLAFLYGRQRRRIGWLWGHVAALFLFWWVFTHRIDRFWVPLIPVVSLLAGVGAAWTAERRWKVVCGGVMAAAVLFNLGYITTSLCGYNAYLFDLNVARANAETTSVGIAYLNRTLPPDAKVLLVGEAQVFDARFPLIYNTVFDRSIFQEWFAEPDPRQSPGALPLRSNVKILETLSQHGVTHVFVNWQEILRYRTTYGYTDFVTPERFETLQDRGVLGPSTVITMPDGRPAYRELSSLSERERGELETWGPQLIQTIGGKRVFVTAELFPVR